MANLTSVSVDSAQKSIIEIGVVLDSSLGNASNASGKVYSSYSTAKYGLKGVLSEKTGARAIAPARKIIGAQKRNVIAISSFAIQEAERIGTKTAIEQIGILSGDSRLLAGYAPSRNRSREYTAIVDGLLDSQELSTLAMIGAEMPNEMIVGDETRSGFYKSSEIIKQVDMFVIAVMWAAFSDVVSWAQEKTGIQYGKIAVAAIDHKTTDCCLRVHGQVRPFPIPFQLTGTPRYGDFLDNPPFHWWCRTAMALYTPGSDTEFVDSMKSASNDELSAREITGSREFISPANAFSRR